MVPQLVLPCDVAGQINRASDWSAANADFGSNGLHGSLGHLRSAPAFGQNFDHSFASQFQTSDYVPARTSRLTLSFLKPEPHSIDMQVFRSFERRYQAVAVRFDHFPQERQEAGENVLGRD